MFSKKKKKTTPANVFSNHKSNFHHPTKMKESPIWWCEPRPEVQNVLSMFPLFALGIFALFHARPGHAMFFHFLTIWISVASTMFHLTHLQFWQDQDQISMLAFVSYVLLVLLLHKPRSMEIHQFLFGLTICANFWLYQSYLATSFWLFIATFTLYTVSLIVQLCLMCDFAPILTFLCGAVFWWAETPGYMEPATQCVASPIQFHAVWHLSLVPTVWLLHRTLFQ